MLSGRRDGCSRFGLGGRRGGRDGDGARGGGGDAGAGASVDEDGTSSTLGAVASDAILVVDGGGGGEDALVGLALSLDARVEATGRAVAGAGTVGGLDNGVVGAVVVGPADSITGGNIELLGGENAVDDVYVPRLGGENGGHDGGYGEEGEVEVHLELLFVECVVEDAEVYG